MPLRYKRSTYNKSNKKYKPKKSKKYKSSSVPSRLRVSTTRAVVNKQISTALRNYGESKFRGYNNSCIDPESKPNGNQPLSYYFYNTGEGLNQTGNNMFYPMELFNFPKGDNATERNGDYMYIKKTHLKMELQMIPQSSTGDLVNGNSSTTSFRFMVVKANRKYNKLGNSPIAAESLFITEENEEFGFSNPSQPVFSNMYQPINKRKWLVYRDQRFTLSTPAQEYVDTSVPGEVNAINTANNKYPVRKLITLDLPVYKKTHFPSDSRTPDSIDTQWLIIIQSTRTNYCAQNVDAPKNMKLNILGTTCATDS